MTGAWRRLGYVVAMALVLGARAAEPVSAEEPGTETLTVYGAVCPVDYAGDRFFEDCYAAPAVGASYQVRNTETGERRPSGGGFATANDAGLVAFEDLSGLAPGTIQILAEAPDEVAIPGGYTVPTVACTAGGDRTVDVAILESGFTGRIVELEVQAGTDLRCAVYFVPVSLQESGDSTKSDEVSAADVVAPATGRPAAIYAGGCPDGEDDLGALVAELTELAAPGGKMMGQVAAVVVETSFSAVPRSLEQLLAERQVIGVGSIMEDNPGLVACGEVGGAVNEKGNLVIGLHEVGDSGFTGIAFLATSSADPEWTDISVFLAAGLADEDAAARGIANALSPEPNRPGLVGIVSVAVNQAKIPEAKRGFGITEVAIDLTNPDHLYASTADDVYASSDRGETWQNVFGVNARISRIVKLPSGERLLAETEEGVMVIPLQP